MFAATVLLATMQLMSGQKYFINLVITVTYLPNKSMPSCILGFLDSSILKLKSGKIFSAIKLKLKIIIITESEPMMNLIFKDVNEILFNLQHVRPQYTLVKSIS